MSKQRRRHGHRDDSLPAPAELDAEIREVIVKLLGIRNGYGREYELGLAAAGGSEVVVSGGHVSKPTEEAWASPSNRNRREACRGTVRLLREAAKKVEKATDVLGGAGAQAHDVSGDSVVTQAAFDRALHLKRERELREEA